MLEVDGVKLRALREAQLLKRAMLEGKSGVSRMTIRAIEQGTRKHPHADTVRKLATALGVEPEELLRDAGAR